MGPITRRAFLIFSLLTFPSLTLSQEKVSAEGLKLARDYILVFQERAKLKAENTFLDGEAQRLQRATASSTIAKKHIILDQKSRQALLRGLVEDGEQVSDVPANLSALLIQKQEALNQKWQQLRAHLLTQQTLLRDARSTTNVVGQLMWTLSFDNLSFWVFAFVVLIVLGLVWIHDRRQELRKLWYGGYSSTKRMIKFLGFFFVALLIIVGVIFFSGDGLYERLLSFRGESGPSPILEAQKEIDAMKQELDPLREQRASLRKKLDEAQSAWNAKVQTEFGANGTEIQQLIQHELTLRQQIGATLVNRDVMADLAKGLDQTITQSKDLQTEIDASQAELASLHRTRAITRVALGTVFLLIGLFGAWRLHRNTKKYRARLEKTCPMCGNQGDIEVVASTDSGVEMVECRQNIDPKDVLSEKCRFRFPSRYRDRTKLCFPTLGHTSSGKTFWLAMVYHQLKKGKRPQDVEMVNIRSSQSQLFDEIVSRIIEERLGPEGTQTAMLPYPLTFRFRDKDRWGVSSPLLTIFDYPGEVAKASDPNARHPMHAHRQRALDADGYLLFLDPTLPSETQATDLQGFRDDLCNLKGIEIGTKLRVPVAICLSKLDLLVKIEKLQGISGEAEHFYTELKKADPSGRALDARTIQKRSRLTEELCSVLWPQWEIQNTIEGLFGNRFLFFPLTPVGLENLGEEDLNKRMILPYAIHAPLLWLLHMNGYPVL